MTDHDALAALLHKHHIGCLEPVDGKSADPGDDAATHANDAAIIIAAGVRATGDAGLREAARLALAAFDAENVAALGTDQDAAEEAALDTVDAMEVLRAAVAGDASEAHPVGDAADTAAPDLRSSAGWLVERWDGNRTVQPDALRADIAVLRDALRNPQALSTLESRPCTTCGGYHFDRGANGRIDATCPVRAALTGDTPEAQP